ncbi:hypothetical protein [Pseudomonas fluorescens]|uniref:Uncharacterized protein n=1 Tax=Pseudomonas fluorescens TaxID=294 RepID=A0A5E7ER99_PSEFL|nr:hypothetical protein [Pseudomonas fluorescens]VVO29339.1 hypothetical protein PS691_04812 [Pseudomonas fluorescens]
MTTPLRGLCALLITITLNAQANDLSTLTVDISDVQIAGLYPEQLHLKTRRWAPIDALLWNTA